MYWSANNVTGSNNFTFDGVDVVTLADTGHYTGRFLGPTLVPIKNTSGVTITKGTPVYATGSVGANGTVEVAGCSASDSAKMPSIGLAAETLAINGQGHAVVFGVIGGLDTSGYSINGTVFVAPNGGLTGTRPTGANDLIQNIGRVVRVQQSTGEIMVSAIGRSNDVPNILQARSYLLMPNGQTATSVVTTWNGASGPITFNDYVSSVNGATGAIVSVAVTGSNTFTGLQTMTAGITASDLWVTNGATFASRSSFNAGLTASNLYVSSGATFASLATFSSGLSSGSTITVNNAVQGLTNGNSFTVRNSPNNSNYITIAATGGNVVAAPGSGKLRVTTGGGISQTTNTSRGFLVLQGTDGEATSYDVTIDPSTSLSAARTLTCPDASGTIALTNSVVTSAVAGVGISVSGATGAVTISNRGVTSFNGSTGAITYYPPTATTSVTGMASFDTNNFSVSSGAVSIKAGGVTNGSLANSSVTVNAGVGLAGGGSVALGSSVTLNNVGVTSFNGSTGAITYYPSLATSSVTGVASFGNQFVVSALGAVSLTANYVSSVNGSTGAVTSIAVTGANTFTGIQTMNSGLTATTIYASSGATFAGAVSSDTGYRVSSSAVNTQTGTSYSLTASDNGKIITMNNGATSTVTIIGGLPVGFNATIIQLGAGNVGFTSASGVTLNSFASSLNMAGQHGAATVIAYATNIFNLSGTLTV